MASAPQAGASNLPLPQFYAQTLASLVPIFDDTVSVSDPSAQLTLATALDNLYLISRMLTSLGVFSDNESLEEVGDGELVFMTVPWVLGECESKVGLGGRDDRMTALKRSEAGLNSFLALLSSYKALSPDEEAESSAMASGAAPRDPARKREAKIRAYKREKELREQISLMSRDRPDTSSAPLTFIISCLPSPPGRPSVVNMSAASTSMNEAQTETRPTTLLILRLLHTLALNALGTIAMELDLLSSAPAEPPARPEDTRENQKQEDDGTWKLDRTPGQYQPRELISGGGRVLRPFTILPSTKGLSDRERLRGEVFRDGHRLPTMTIDEYLEEERRRGNIITGGGQASYDAPTESELLELAGEEDGTVAGEAKSEQKRLKEESWAQYTEANRKGAGNTMNRG